MTLSKDTGSAPPFRMALLGTGKITSEEHLPAVLASPGVEVSALVDTVPERARALARQFALESLITTSLTDLPGRVDGAIVATPNNTHAPLALELVRAGIPVLVEKPMSTTLTEALEVVEAAEQEGVTVAVGYSWRFWDSVDLFAELLRREWFGRPIRFLYVEGSAGGWSPLSGYILDKKAAGGGVTVVSGSHFLDRMLHWFGFPKRIEYFDDAEGGPEANSLTRLEFVLETGPMKGEIRLSKTTPLNAGFVFETDRGIATLYEQLHSPIRFRPHGDSDLEMVLQRRGTPRFTGRKTMYQWQLEDFVAACQTGRPPRVPGRQGLASVRLLETMYRNRRPLRDGIERSASNEPIDASATAGEPA